MRPRSGEALLHMGRIQFQNPVDRPPIGVSTTPHENPSVGEEIGDSWEGEDPKSPSFTEILKKNPRPSPPLTRGRKSNKNHREKEAELGISGGSQ
jgi:hypothetical protein